MKKLIPVFFLLAITGSYTQAQKISFTDLTNEWYVRVNTGHPVYDTSYYKYYYRGVADIDSVVYNKMYRLDPKDKTDMQIALVRHDSTDNIIYLYTSNGDYPLYNYNWSIGDTVHSQGNMYDSGLYHIVTKVDSILLNNVYHRVFYLKVIDSKFLSWGLTYYVIEGIGWPGGPLGPSGGWGDWHFYASVRSIWQSVLCFKNQGIYPAPRFLSCSDSFVKVMLDVEVPASKQNTLVVYPQPATTHANIQLTETIKTGTLYLFNQMGQTLLTEHIQDKQHIRLNAPALPGLYYYRITDNTTGKAWQGKVLFE